MIDSWQHMQSIEYSDDYHCEHFAVDCYQFLTGIDVSKLMLTGSTAQPFNIKNFVKIDNPVQHCFVLFREKNKAHIGVWHDNQVLHLNDMGVVSQSLEIASRGFKRVGFYQCKS